MEKEHHCNCTTGCDTYRCSCLKNHEPCGETCGCVDCQNPLNDVDVDGLSLCAIQNIDVVKSLTGQELEREYKLPCGHEAVPLEELIGKIRELDMDDVRKQIEEHEKAEAAGETTEEAGEAAEEAE